MPHTHVLIKNKKKLLIGKTIKAIDARAVNMLRLEFTDGTKVAIEVESMGVAGLEGMVICSDGTCTDA